MAFYRKQIATRDTPADVAWRLANNAARAQARSELTLAYPVITVENFAEAAAFQERRIDELTRAIEKGNRNG